MMMMMMIIIIIIIIIILLIYPKSALTATIFGLCIHYFLRFV